MSSYYIDTMTGQRQAVVRAFDDLSADACGRVEKTMTHVFRILCRWQQRAQDRQRLSAMTWDRLHDIGITAADAEREARKPFWVT